MIEEVGSRSKAKFIDYKNSPPRNKDERTILSNLEISKPLRRVDLRSLYE